MSLALVISCQPLRTSTGAGSLALEESKTALEAHRQATEDLQVELAKSQERSKELDEMCSELHKRMQRVTMEAELEKTANSARRAFQVGGSGGTASIAAAESAFGIYT